MTLQQFEAFICLAFLQYADFVTTWLFSITTVDEGNPLIKAFHHGGTLLERVILIKLFCLLLLANMFLRKRNPMSWGNRAVRWIVRHITAGHVVLEPRHFYRTFVVLMLIGISWNLLAALSMLLQF